MLSLVLGGVMLAYLLAGILFLMGGLWTSPRVQDWARVTLWAGLGAHTGALLGRWVASYRLALEHTPVAGWAESLRLVILQVPLSNFYESLVFFSWCLPLVALLTWRRHLQGALATVAATLACLLLAYASLGGVDSRIKPLMPALKSNWLLIHVVTCFLGYAALALAFGAALLYLFQTRRPRPSLPPAAQLDNLIYQATTLGFLLLSLGILTGAVWAESAWGRYWSWDPKETWSLITWFLYAALFHGRLTVGWRGRRAAIFAIVGFAALVFTFLGVNLLLSGLHSYN
jgi:cytochrome c-type biogenesis protein CcsB